MSVKCKLHFSVPYQLVLHTFQLRVTEHCELYYVILTDTIYPESFHGAV